MRINIFIVLVLIILVAIAAFVIGKRTSAQVVDSNNKKVKGKFLSTDGVTASLQA